MKKHVRVFLAVFVAALALGYIGLRSDNADLEQKIAAHKAKKATAAADDSDDDDDDDDGDAE